jgi:hypothetical protein
MKYFVEPKANGEPAELQPNSFAALMAAYVANSF